MTRETNVRAHPRKGTRGVRHHPRTIADHVDQKIVPHNPRPEFSEENLRKNRRKIEKIKESLKYLEEDEYEITTHVGTIEIKFDKYPYRYSVFSFSGEYPHKLEYYRNKMFEDGLDTTRDISERTFSRNLKRKLALRRASKEYIERFGEG